MLGGSCHGQGTAGWPQTLYRIDTKANCCCLKECRGGRTSVLQRSEHRLRAGGQVLGIARRHKPRLRRDQGRRAEARDPLAPVHGWFTEGFDIHDLKEAKTLFDELLCPG
jgi:hypothetical protein